MKKSASLKLKLKFKGLKPKRPSPKLIRLRNSTNYNCSFPQHILKMKEKTMHDLQNKFVSFKIQHQPVRQLLSKSLNVMVLLLLTLTVGACEGLAGLVVEAPKPAQLPYLNPPRPNPVLPYNLTFKTMTEWQDKISKGEVRSSDLVCLTHEDKADSLAWKKDVTRWMKQSSAIIKFHEDQNQ